MDRPGGLKKHERVVPYGGGVGIFAGILCSLAAVGLWTRGTGEPAFGSFHALLTGGGIVFLGGMVDDARPLGPFPKFLFQFTAAVVVLLGGVHLDVKVLPVWLNLVLTILWIVGVINAVNIIDILDGLAGMICGAAGITLALVGLLNEDVTLAVMGTSVFAAATAFLLFNFPPAKIFMGDAGSQTLGFFLAAGTIMGSYTTFNNIALLAPVLILGVPIYDTILVILFRLRKGRSPFRGSEDHVALRLKKMGFSDRAAVGLLGGVTVCLSAAAVVAMVLRLWAALAVYAFVAVALSLFAFWIGRVKVE
ncbi:MAG: undecaprenyl/decaprenyl-phosphate alpha-N-acetylglucosaminyl 1-phosphate transferase [Candidatus Hydrogenedentota bacterium]|nr:MAG: undecaprenyl/decaprenyl-phosphate alpha-N-acetylglucosaminyl 1-phosphate transferase [Candidatus Hydrogenedentota bacterium]